MLGSGEEPICFCVADMHGRLSGHIILAFSDASGFALADLLLDQPRGTASEWGEFEISAALETSNILGCTYLNTLMRELPVIEGSPEELMPTPPVSGGISQKVCFSSLSWIRSGRMRLWSLPMSTLRSTVNPSIGRCSSCPMRPRWLL